jgi:F0F1-type ATP synthase assembly protein I
MNISLDKISKSTSAKTIAGVVVGVGVGHFVFKSKSPLFLIAIGIAGGLLTNLFFKTKAEKEAEETEKYLSAMEQDIKKSISLTNPNEEEKTNFYGTNKEMEFNERLGYHTPSGELTATEPKDFMDINFK